MEDVMREGEKKEVMTKDVNDGKILEF